MPRYMDTCAHCGYVREKKSLVQDVPGEMTELQTMSRENKQDFYSELIYYARLHGYKEGYAAVKYKEKFGVYPRGLQATPKETSAATAKWLRSRAIAWAKSRRK